MRKALVAPGQLPAGQGDPLPAVVLKKWPTVAEFLTATVWEDGSPREPGTVLVFVEDGWWKCWVNDKAQGRSAFVTGASLLALADSVERGLSTDVLDWRRAKERPQGGRRR